MDVDVVMDVEVDTEADAVVVDAAEDRAVMIVKKMK